jgi:integrase
MRDVERKVGAYFVTLRTGKGKTRVRTIAASHQAPSTVLDSLWNPAKREAQLFPSFNPGGYDAKLSWAVSKAFGRYRDALGLPREVDFHSFRRTLVTPLENLRVHQVANARYVGHALPTLAFTVYSAGSTEKTNREVARKIRYSATVEKAMEAFLKQAGAAEARAA